MTSAAMPNSASRPWPAIRAGKCDRAGPVRALRETSCQPPGRSARTGSKRRTGSATSRSGARSSAPAARSPHRHPTRCRPRREPTRPRMVLKPRRSSLIQPVDLYSQVNRATKYGFLFIGFTFLALLMFDVIAGVRVSAVDLADRGSADPILRLAARLCRSHRLRAGLCPGVDGDRRPQHRLCSRSASKLAPRFLHRRIAGGTLRSALCLAQPRGLFAAGWRTLLFAALAGVMYLTRQIDWSTARARRRRDAVTV